MKKFILFILLSFSLFAESIDKYEVYVDILKSGSLEVKERILYNFQNTPHHGIYRDIPYLMKTDFIPKDIGISDFKIFMDNKEIKWKKIYESINQKKFIRLKIGDPNRTFIGKHLYEISYKIKRAVLYKDKINDAIRYNAIGTGWRVPIKNILISISLPSPLNRNNIKFKLFKGRYSSKELISSFKWINDRKIEAKIDRLNPREGVTFEIIFKRGLLEQSGEENQKASLKDYILAYIQFPIIFLFLGFLYKEYSKHSYFKKRSIAVMYEPPKNLDVLQSGLILDKFADTKDFSAAVIELAQKGYLEIFQPEKKGFSFNTTKSIATFKKTDKPTKDLSEDEKYLMEHILFKNSDTFILKKDPHTSKQIREGFSHINERLYEWAVKNGYFKENPKKTRISFLIKTVSIAFLITLLIGFISYIILPTDIIFSSIFIAIFISTGLVIGIKSKNWAGKIFGIAFISMSLFIFIPLFKDEWKYIFLTPLSFIIISVLVISILYRKIGDYTPKGYRVYLHLEGLREFIKRVKEDEIKRFLKEEPLFLDKLLPYAVLFDLTKHWIKFYDISNASYPYWYHGNFNDFYYLSDQFAFISSDTSQSDNSMDAGGGFSGVGGGIGGGGGGSW